MLDMTIHNEEKPKIKIAAKNLNFFYGDHQSLFDNNLEIPENRITAVIGPSGCGKSTHLRIYNRIFELYREQRVEGEVIIDGQNILDRNVDVLELRRKVGMIFQRPTPFPMSVFDNVAYGMRLHFKLRKNEIAERVEAALRGASLWDEQQQRLCIARTIAAEPDILLLDEPTSAIDPVATLKIEELLLKLRRKFTIVIVTHNMQQASRISDFTAFFYKGHIIEHDTTAKIFTNPSNKKTEEYITGRFG